MNSLANCEGPLPDRPIQVVDVINHNGIDCRVEEILENDNAMVRPIIPASRVEYRIDDSSWKQFQSVQE